MKNLSRRMTLILFAAFSLLFGGATLFSTTSVYAEPTDANGNPITFDNGQPTQTNPTDANGNPIDFEEPPSTDAGNDKKPNTTANPTDANGNPIDFDSEDSEDSEKNPSSSTETNPTDADGNPIVISDETPTSDQAFNPETDDTICQGQTGSVSWIICSTVDVTTRLVDNIYNFIEGFLVVKPLATDNQSAIYKVWSYLRELTNIVFIIFMLIVIYSQITGLGISNYGVKRILPRLIIAVILVNLSFFLSSIAVDISNIIGSGISNTLGGIQDQVLKDIPDIDISWSDFSKYLVGGVAVAAIGVVAAEGVGAIFWMVVVALIGAIISIFIGLVTISLRQGLVYILIMISPFAFVSYLLPNTEKWFEKWKNLLFQMLVFYPMFAFLFSASKLAGWAIIASASESGNGMFSMFEVLLGLAVQVLPLFLSITLMKMSSTVLGRISSGLDRLSNPIRGAVGKWGDSHIEKNRAFYREGNHVLTGARLRNYLAERQKRRELDAANARNIVDNRLNTRVTNRAAGYLGRDAYGREIYRARPIKSTRLAKEAKYQETLSTNSQKMLSNNLNQYGDIFRRSAAARRLSDAHGEAFVDSMAQSFRAANIAQADQSYLLNRYIAASKNRYRNPYEYNRLIKSANGGLGADGENTILGQVIRESVEMESRNRRDAAVIKAKFNFDKPLFRAFMLDKYSVGDNGRETNADGDYIEDDLFHYYPGMENQHRQYPYYFGKHKVTGDEITKEEYDTLSDQEREAYRRVRYMPIYDDNDDVVQSFTLDDAGYVKEMITQDIAIGDSINDRYNISYGKKGELRRYHSTMSSGMLAGKYNEHASEVGPMLAQHLNNGDVNSIEEYNIASIRAFAVASKPKNFLIQDSAASERYLHYLMCAEDESMFQKYFPDWALVDFTDVNGQPLDGLRFDEATNSWVEVKRKDATIEDLRNHIKHRDIPKFARTLVNHFSKPVTPNITENQKTSGVLALMNLADYLKGFVIRNYDETIPFTERPDPNLNLIGDKKGNRTDLVMAETKAKLEKMLAEAKAREGIEGDAPESLQDFNRQAAYRANTSTAEAAGMDIDELVNDKYVNNPESVAAAARAIFSENDELRDYTAELERHIESYLDQNRPDNNEDFIDNMTTNRQAYDAERAEGVKNIIDDFYNDILAGK